MYIYIDKTGTITTQIDHGEPVRQGNELKMVICFDKDDPNINENSILELRCRMVDRHSNWNGDPYVFTMSQSFETFRKIKTSEMTYDLIDGERYRMFRHYNSETNGALPVDEYTTANYGKLECLIELYTNGEKLITDTAEINVSATYGKITPKHYITQTEYNRLLSEISKRVKADGGIANNLTLTGTTIVDVSVSNVVKFVLNDNQEISVDDVKKYDYIQYNGDIYTYNHFDSEHRIYCCVAHNNGIFEVKSIIVKAVKSIPEKIVYNIEFPPVLELGETSTTAYPGNKGKELSEKVVNQDNQINTINSNITAINEKLQNEYPHLESGKVPSKYLPSYVDDVVEVPGIALQETGEFGKIYVDVNTNKVYRWSGTRMIEIVGGGSNNAGTIQSFLKKYTLEENEAISIADVKDYDFIDYKSNIYTYSHYNSTSMVKVYCCLYHSDTEFKVESIIIQSYANIPQVVVSNLSKITIQDVDDRIAEYLSANYDNGDEGEF